MERISIPDAKPPSLARQAADIALAAMREAGMNPNILPKFPGVLDMVQQAALRWRNGEYTRADFVRICQNLTILNPALKLGTPPASP